MKIWKSSSQLWTTGQISTKHGSKHPRVMSTQVYLNEGSSPFPFPRGDSYEIEKSHWRNLNIFSRTAWPISTKPATQHPWVKGIQACSNEETLNSHKVNNWFFSSLNQHYDNNNGFFYLNIFSGERCGPWACCCPLT